MGRLLERELEALLKVDDRNQLIVEMTAWIPREHLALESTLNRTKWFDYRFMSSMKATAVFAKEYQRFFQAKHARTFSSEEAPKKRGIPLGGILDSRGELNGTWKARQVADAIGVPYGFFIEAAMSACLDAGWKRIPRPNQLTADWIVVKVTSKWEEWCKATFPRSKLPHYRLENYQGIASQDDHQAWVLQQLKDRGGNSHAVGKVCFLERVVPPALAEMEFGRERLEAARAEVASEEPAPVEELTIRELLPSCSMLPGAFKAHETCYLCSSAWPCEAAQPYFATLFKLHYGAADPAAARKREGTRLRVAKHRALRRARLLETVTLAGDPLSRLAEGSD